MIFFFFLKGEFCCNLSLKPSELDDQFLLALRCTNSEIVGTLGTKEARP